MSEAGAVWREGEGWLPRSLAFVRKDLGGLLRGAPGLPGPVEHVLQPEEKLELSSDPGIQVTLLWKGFFYLIWQMFRSRKDVLCGT